MLTALGIFVLLAAVALPIVLLASSPKAGVALIALIILSAALIVGLAWIGSFSGAGSALCAASIGFILASIAWAWFLKRLKHPHPAP